MYKITNIMEFRVGNNRGLTLVEVLAVIIILGIIAAIAVPSVSYLIEKSREDVCLANRTKLNKQYEVYLVLESKENTVINAKEYIFENGVDICPSGGKISYEDGEVKCSIHSHSDEGDPGEEDNEVPFL